MIFQLLQAEALNSSGGSSSHTLLLHDWIGKLQRVQTNITDRDTNRISMTAVYSVLALIAVCISLPASEWVSAREVQAVMSHVIPHLPITYLPSNLTMLYNKVQRLASLERAEGTSSLLARHNKHDSSQLHVWMVSIHWQSFSNSRFQWCYQRTPLTVHHKSTECIPLNVFKLKSCLL